MGALQRRVVPSTRTIKPHRLCPHLWKYPVALFTSPWAGDGQVYYWWRRQPLRTLQESFESWFASYQPLTCSTSCSSPTCVTSTSFPSALPITRLNTTASSSARKSTDAALMAQQTKCQPLHYWWLAHLCVLVSAFFFSPHRQYLNHGIFGCLMKPRQETKYLSMN